MSPTLPELRRTYKKNLAALQAACLHPFDQRKDWAWGTKNGKPGQVCLLCEKIIEYCPHTNSTRKRGYGRGTCKVVMYITTCNACGEVLDETELDHYN